MHNGYVVFQHTAILFFRVKARSPKQRICLHLSLYDVIGDKEGNREMTQNPSPQTLGSEDEDALKQSEAQDNLRTLQEGLPDANKSVERMKPHFPEWPTSKRGPMSTPPPPGMRSINPMRAEQVAEVGYNQETGEPSTQSPLRSQPDETRTGHTGFDQLETAQEMLRKRKERL
jgi:hypothetical protein